MRLHPDADPDRVVDGFGELSASNDAFPDTSGQLEKGKELDTGYGFEVAGSLNDVNSSTTADISWDKADMESDIAFNIEANP